MFQLFILGENPDDAGVYLLLELFLSPKSKTKSKATTAATAITSAKPIRCKTKPN